VSSAGSFDLARITRGANPVVAAGAAGAVFLASLAGVRILSPASVDWVLKLDWQYHFLGWHFFRREGWQMPPGLVQTYNAPVGTSVGFTDSIPLVALLLKPFSAWLPASMQYFGLWLLLCFALQGVFGALLTRLWTSRPLLQFLGGALFVVVPTLLGRVGHGALSAHWLILWSLWLYLREPGRRASVVELGLLGLLAGLIHPYLAIMVLALIGAVSLRRLWQSPHAGVRRYAVSTLPLASCGAAMLAGWWLSGLLSLPGSTDLASTGLDTYSMNLLGPIAPVGWSGIMPEVPLASQTQEFEGFQYLGLGLLLLIAGALVAGRWRADLRVAAMLPLVLVVAAFGIYALSPRITLGTRVVIDVLTPAMERFAVFRATGRFFWPAAYALLAFAIWVVVTRLPPRLAVAALSAALGLQAIDLGGHYASLHATARSEAFHTWPRTLTDGVWRTMLPHYKRVLLYPPEQCGPAPVAFLHPALLAGEYGLGINTGHMARVNRSAIASYCASLFRDLDAGRVENDAVYLVHRDLLDRFRRHARAPVVCAQFDGIPTCVTASSAVRWSEGFAFQ
jgi:hypothetical protein